MTKPPLRDPGQIVCAKARGYLYHGKYPQVCVFTKYISELDHLVTAFGGHYYKHLAGYIWVLSRRSEIATMMTKVKPWLPSCHGFENILGDVSR